MCQHRHITLLSRIFSFHLSRIPLNGFHLGDVNFCLEKHFEKNRNEQTFILKLLYQQIFVCWVILNKIKKESKYFVLKIDICYHIYHECCTLVGSSHLKPQLTQTKRASQCWWRTFLFIQNSFPRIFGFPTNFTVQPLPFFSLFASPEKKQKFNVWSIRENKSGNIFKSRPSCEGGKTTSCSLQCYIYRQNYESS